MRDNGHPDSEKATEGGQLAAIEKRRVVIGLAVCAALVAVGVWRGDFGEIFRNGTML